MWFAELFILLFWRLQKSRKAGVSSGIYQQFVQHSQTIPRTIPSQCLQMVSTYRWQNTCRAYFVLRFNFLSNSILTDFSKICSTFLLFVCRPFFYHNYIDHWVNKNSTVILNYDGTLVNNPNFNRNYLIEGQFSI